MNRAPRRQEVAFGGLVALLLALHVALAAGQIPDHSPAADEPIHIAAGYRHWLTGESIDPTHPPLARLVMVLPLLAQRADPIVGDSTGAALERFLLDNRVPRGRMLGSTRVVAVGFSLALLVVAGLWSRRLWGRSGALLTVAALAFSPLLLADAPIAGNDVACALTVTLAVATFGRYLRDPSGRTLAVFALCFAVAQATKFSAILLVPICAALYVARRLLERAARAPAPASTSAPPSLGTGRLLRDMALVAAASALFVWGVYGFELASLGGDRELAIHPRAGAVRAAIAQLPTWLRDLPVPAYSFVKGFALQSFHAANQATWTGGYNHQFLFGDNSPDGWWYYFPLALAVKTPLPFFALVVWALATLRPRRSVRGAPAGPSAGGDGLRSFEIALLVVPALFWLGACMMLTINIGIRYLLPMFPFLAILVGALGPVVAGRPRSTALAAALLAWQAFGTVRAYPHVHAYFNELAGGPAGGWRYLNNSSIDWGQDLPALARYLEEHQIRSPYFDYFGGIDPAAWGIPHRRLPDPGAPLDPAARVLVVSQSRLTARGPHEPLYRHLRTRPPLARLGGTLFVYPVSPGPR
jgi:hypothetical protein